MSNRPSEPRTRRYAVFTPGFSGSNWLTAALSRPEDGLIAFHEPVKHLVAPALQLLSAFDDPEVPLARTALVEALAPYLEWAERRQREVPVFGEVHTHPLFYWPLVKGLLPDLRLMLLRHGVQTVHAMTSAVMYEAIPYEKRWAQRSLPAVYRPAPEYERVFASICQTWASLPALARELSPGMIVRLEDLTSDASALQEAYTYLVGRPIDERWSATMRGQVIHKRTRGDNSPANLFWNVWTDQMREMFVTLSMEAMTFFGYSLPPQADAPPPDLRPRESNFARPLPLGPLANLWAFSSSPQLQRVIVLGQPRYALAAANLLGADRAILFDDGHWDSRGRPEGHKFCTLDQLTTLRDICVYVADPSPAPGAIARLHTLQPNAEIVVMQPGALSDDDLLTLKNSGTLGGRHAPAASRTPNATDTETSVPTFGPFRVGDVLAGWKLERLSVSVDKLLLHLERIPDGTLDFELCVAQSAHHSPFRVRDGALYYRSTALAFGILASPARVIAQRVNQAMGDQPMATVFTEWRQ